MNDIRVLTILITKKVCTHENVQLYTERNNKDVDLHSQTRR